MEVGVQDGSHPAILGAMGLPCGARSFVRSFQCGLENVWARSWRSRPLSHRPPQKRSWQDRQRLPGLAGSPWPTRWMPLTQIQERPPGKRRACPPAHDITARDFVAAQAWNALGQCPRTAAIGTMATNPRFSKFADSRCRFVEFKVTNAMSEQFCVDSMALLFLHRPKAPGCSEWSGFHQEVFHKRKMESSSPCEHSNCGANRSASLNQTQRPLFPANSGTRQAAKNAFGGD